MVVLALALTLTAPAEAGSRKAKKLFNQARQAEFVRDYDKALAFLNKPSTNIRDIKAICSPCGE